MTLVKTLNSNFPNYLEGFFGKDSSDVWFPRTVGNIPPVNVFESNEEFVIEMAAPGFEKEDLKMTLQRNFLIISTKKEQDTSNSNKKYTKKEFCYDAFERVFTLPNSAEGDKIEASYTQGILKVVIPKKDEAKIKAPRSIEIK